MPGTNSALNKQTYDDESLRQEEEKKYKEAIRKIISASYLFDGMNERLVMNLIIRCLGNKLLKVEGVPIGSIVIKEGDKECNYFLLILSGNFSITKDGTEIGNINSISVVGEIGFLDPELGRTATVKADTKGHILKINDRFLNKLSSYDYGLFHRNLARCLSRKLITTTNDYSLLRRTGELITSDDCNSKVIKMDDIKNHDGATRVFKEGVTHIL